MKRTNVKFKGFSYDDPSKPLADTAYFDGYNFGDTLLEGVMFKAEIKDNGTMAVSFVNPHGEYEKGLNQRKWLKEAKEYAEENDIFLSQPDNGEDLVLVPTTE